MHTCQCEGLRPDTRQLLPQVLGAPAELGGPSWELLLPGAWAETARTGPPAATAPAGNEPSKQSGNKKRISDFNYFKRHQKKKKNYLIATVSNSSKQNEEMQWLGVGQIKLESTENFPLHPQQLVLRISVVHQVAESRHLQDKTQDVHQHRLSSFRLRSIILHIFFGLCALTILLAAWIVFAPRYYLYCSLLQDDSDCSERCKNHSTLVAEHQTCWTGRST